MTFEEFQSELMRLGLNLNQIVMEMAALNKEVVHPVLAFGAISMGAAETKGLANLLITKKVITQEEYFRFVLDRIQQEIDDLRFSVNEAKKRRARK
jgi:hypothetical protein